MMTRKPKSAGKSKAAKDPKSGVDDRHLPHPHAEAVDPAGGAVFDAAAGASTDDIVAAAADPEKPTADSDVEAIGYAVFEDCADPDADDSFGGGDGVGAVVRDDCDDPDGEPAAATIASTSGQRGAAVSAGTAPGMGAAVLPDGRVDGGAEAGGEIREGYGLVFPG